MGIDSLKKELVKIEDAVKMKNFSAIENLLKTSHKIAMDSEVILKELLEKL